MKISFILTAFLISALNGKCNKKISNQTGIESSDSRIVGGWAATYSEYPWIVSISEQGRGHLCGGTLLNLEVVITAAHCINDLTKNITIRYGSQNLDNMLQANIKSIMINPDYEVDKQGNLINDIGLIHLTSPIEENARAILGMSSNIQDNERVVVSGWGYTHYDGEVSQTLKQVELSTLNKDICMQTWPQLNPDTQICAWFYKGGKDACQGDSGGPLMNFDRDGNYLLLGIISNGIGCANQFTPAIYTRVAYYVPWIINTLNDWGVGFELQF